MKPITDVDPNEPPMREQFERIQELRNEGQATHGLDGKALDLWVHEAFKEWMAGFKSHRPRNK